MKVFELDTVFESGNYSGKNLLEVFEQDPDFIEQSLLNDQSFLVNEKAIREMSKLNPAFGFSPEALGKNDRKWAMLDAMMDTEYVDEALIQDMDEDFDLEGFEETDGIGF